MRLPNSELDKRGLKQRVVWSGQKPYVNFGEDNWGIWEDLNIRAKANGIRSNLRVLLFQNMR
jgi:hypothetical protein